MVVVSSLQRRRRIGGVENSTKAIDMGLTLKPHKSRSYATIIILY
jgi:hypothetical protein